jgi:hypothetical protein
MHCGKNEPKKHADLSRQIGTCRSVDSVAGGARLAALHRRTLGVFTGLWLVLGFRRGGGHPHPSLIVRFPLHPGRRTALPPASAHGRCTFNCGRARDCRRWRAMAFRTMCGMFRPLKRHSLPLLVSPSIRGGVATGDWHRDPSPFCPISHSTFHRAPS